MGGQRSRGQGKNSKTPAVSGDIDFDALVTQGVITQETRDKIKTYMDKRDQPASADAGAASPDSAADATSGATQKGNQQTRKQKKASSQNTGLLVELLQAGIITQAEFDAITAALNSAGTTAMGSNT